MKLMTIRSIFLTIFKIFSEKERDIILSSVKIFYHPVKKISFLCVQQNEMIIFIVSRFCDHAREGLVVREDSLLCEHAFLRRASSNFRYFAANMP